MLSTPISFLLTQCFDIQLQVIRLRAGNNTHRKLNLAQELEKKNFGVRCLNKVIHLVDRYMMAASLK